MGILSLLNSTPMYAICGGIIAFVAAVCIVFMVRAYRAGIAMGMDPVKLKRLSGSKGVVRVVWSKGRNINGYQVRFSKKKSMVNPKIKTVTNPSKTRLAVKGLRGSRTWYVQVRCYKKVDGEVYCSKWSGKKKVRIY